MPFDNESRGRGGGGCGVRLIMAVVVMAVAWIGYQGMRQSNPVTGETQHVALSQDQEIALGLQAAPQMAEQFGGLEEGTEGAATVDRIGARLVRADDKIAQSGYQFEFHLLADKQTINAFALPGGQIFITRALYDKLTTEGQVAGVLGHEIGHVVERHGAEQMAKAQLTQGLTAAAAAATYDPENPNSAAGQAVAAMVGQLINMKYGREDELESDEWGVEILVKGGYDPMAMVAVMDVLEQAAGGGGRQPEFLSTHPNPGNRRERIREAIQKLYPNGLPSGLKK